MYAQTKRSAFSTENEEQRRAAIELCYNRAIGSDVDKQQPYEKNGAQRIISIGSAPSATTAKTTTMTKNPYVREPSLDAEHLSFSKILPDSENLIPGLTELQLYHSLDMPLTVPKPSDGMPYLSTKEQHDLFRKSSQVPISTSSAVQRKRQVGDQSTAESENFIRYIPQTQQQKAMIRRSAPERDWLSEVFTGLKQLIWWILYMMYLVPRPESFQ